jgi:hypothetical protein
MIRKRKEQEMPAEVDYTNTTLTSNLNAPLSPSLPAEEEEMKPKVARRSLDIPKLVVVTPTEDRVTFDGKKEYVLRRGEAIAVTPSFKKILEKARIILEIEESE